MQHVQLERMGSDRQHAAPRHGTTPIPKAKPCRLSQSTHLCEPTPRPSIGSCCCGPSKQNGPDLVGVSFPAVVESTQTHTCVERQATGGARAQGKHDVGGKKGMYVQRLRCDFIAANENVRGGKSSDSFRAFDQLYSDKCGTCSYLMCSAGNRVRLGAWGRENCVKVGASNCRGRWPYHWYFVRRSTPFAIPAALKHAERERRLSTCLEMWARKRCVGLAMRMTRGPRLSGRSVNALACLEPRVTSAVSRKASCTARDNSHPRDTSGEKVGHPDLIIRNYSEVTSRILNLQNPNTTSTAVVYAGCDAVGDLTLWETCESTRSDASPLRYFVCYVRRQVVAVVIHLLLAETPSDAMPTQTTRAVVAFSTFGAPRGHARRRIVYCCGSCSS